MKWSTISPLEKKKKLYKLNEQELQTTESA